MPPLDILLLLYLYQIPPRCTPPLYPRPSTDTILNPSLRPYTQGMNPPPPCQSVDKILNQKLLISVDAGYIHTYIHLCLVIMIDRYDTIRYDTIQAGACSMTDGTFSILYATANTTYMTPYPFIVVLRQSSVFVPWFFS